MIRMLAKMKTALFDESVPIEIRRQFLAQLCSNDNEKCTKITDSVLKAAASSKTESVYKKKLEALEETIGQFENGPLRLATFIRTFRTLKEPSPRASVLFEDGSSALVTVSSEELANELRCGDTVILEAQGKMLLGSHPEEAFAGEEARLERILPDGRIEVSVRDHEKLVIRASAALARQMSSGAVEPGRMLMVCSRRMMAFEALPVDDSLSSYRFLAKDGVPDVLLERDIGDPPQYIGEISGFAYREMTRPEVRRRYRLPRCVLKLLTGVTGSGKTYSILALWRRLYEVMAEVTGVPMDSLPQRVMRLRPADVLSKWLGESDKNVDLFFDEVESLASEPFVAPDGHSHELPVLVIIEEIDGLGRSRGEDAVYDRVLTTILQRLDTSRRELRDRFVLIVGTTNVPQHVDAAFLRRLGGSIERFGRLTRRACAAVLDKHLLDRPLAGTDGNGRAMKGIEEARAQLVADVAGWLFPPAHADEAQVELTYAGSTVAEAKYRRDFLTASLIDRAVQQAARWACEAEAGSGHPDSGTGPGEGQPDLQAVDGLTREGIIEAIDDQVRAIVEQLHVSNAHHYVDLPDGVRVANLRRLRRPAIQPFRLERVA